MKSTFKEIDHGFDEVLKTDYRLLAATFRELKEMVLDWYPGVNFTDFDEDTDKCEQVREDFDKFNTIVKSAGLVSNYFFAYMEGSECYLLDGFNRLLTNCGKMPDSHPVYLKMITTPLKDHELVRVMFYLNLWKIKRGGHSGFSINMFLDRGMRLLFHKKFGVDFYSRDDYDTRGREYNDFNLLDYYFRNEYESCGDFKLQYEGVLKLMSNPRIVDDIRELCRANDYMEKDVFNRYENFLRGFAMSLTRRRLSGDENVYEFKDALETLEQDTKFFTKLQKMSWTDSTRKNVYKWFRRLEAAGTI